MNATHSIRMFVRGAFIASIISATSVSALAAGSVIGPAATSLPHATVLPDALRPALYQALDKNAGAAYRIKADGCARLPKSSLKACFDSHGAHFTGAARPLTLHLAALGRGEKLAPVNQSRPVIKGNRVTYPHRSFSEWWRVLPVGFEQGLTLTKRPAGHGELVLALTATSRRPGESRDPVGKASRPAVKIHHQTGLRIAHSASGMTETKNSDTLTWGKLRYGGLVVTDANGKTVPAILKSKGNRILIVVDDAHAAYPLTVDPLVYIEQKVTAADGAANDNFGISVAVDGATALVGADGHNNGEGTAYVFTESGGTWSLTQELAASDGVADDFFGFSVALDGTTALVGAWGRNNFQGAAYVFTKSDGTWSQTQELTASDGAVDDNFGYSVALDGTAALVGAPQVFYSEGAAYVFTKTGGTWSETQELYNPVSISFGTSVALDGDTAVIGSPGDNVGFADDAGAVYVFTKTGGTWSQTQRLTASDSVRLDNFGGAVALDGSTLLAGATSHNNDKGAAYVFSESGGTWSQAQELAASDGAPGDEFGSAIALDGTTALVGATQFHFNQQGGPGAAYVFSESGGTWSQAQKLVASDGAENDDFGGSVALDSTTALVGAYGHNDSRGAAYFEGASSLDLAVSAPTQVNPGATFVSQTIVTNSSSAASPAVSATITVPAAASYVSASATQGSCNEASGVVTCDFGQINGNAGTATANVTLKATGSDGDMIENTASVAHATPLITANAATVIQTPNHPPVASNGTLTTTENTAASGTLQATDADGNPLTFSIFAKPGHGSVTLNDASKGTYTYTPNQGYAGSDSFTFKANDGQADSNTATISITVKAAPPPLPPPPPPRPRGGGGGSGSFGWLGLFTLLSLALTGPRPKR
ncbi:MAG: Ig-like domain-containing protein [Gammaproteobacteria bacterium]